MLSRLHFGSSSKNYRYRLGNAYVVRQLVPVRCLEGFLRLLSPVPPISIRSGPEVATYDVTRSRSVVLSDVAILVASASSTTASVR